MRAVDAVAQLGNLRLQLRGGNGPLLRVYLRWMLRLPLANDQGLRSAERGGSIDISACR